MIRKTEAQEMWASLTKWAIGAGSASVFAVALLWILVEYQMKPANLRLERQEERMQKSHESLQALMSSQISVNAEMQKSIERAAVSDEAVMSAVMNNGNLLAKVQEVHLQQTNALNGINEQMTEASNMMREAPAERKKQTAILEEIRDAIERKSVN